MSEHTPESQAEREQRKLLRNVQSVVDEIEELSHNLWAVDVRHVLTALADLRKKATDLVGTSSIAFDRILRS